MRRQPAGFWALFCTDMVVRVGYQMIKSPVLPIVAASLGANKVMIGTIVGVSTLTGSVFKPIFGGLSDRWGRKLWLYVAVLLFAGFPFLYPIADTTGQLIALRILHGTATAIFGPVSLAIVSEFGSAHRAHRLGIYEIARSLGHLIAPALVGFLLIGSGVSTIFTVAGLLGLAALVPAALVPATRDIIFEPNRQGIFRSFSNGIMGIAWRREVWGVALVEFATYGSLYSLKAFLPFLAVASGQSVWSAGVFFGLQEGAHLLMRPYGGRHADRRGAPFTVAIGLAAIGVGLILLPFMSSVAGLLLLATLIGSGQGMIFPATVTVIASVTSSTHIGLGLGIYGALRSSGKVAGPILVGAMLEIRPATTVFPGLGAAAVFGCFGLLALQAKMPAIRSGRQN